MVIVVAVVVLVEVLVVVSAVAIAKVGPLLKVVIKVPLLWTAVAKAYATTDRVPVLPVSAELELILVEVRVLVVLENVVLPEEVLVVIL